MKSVVSLALLVGLVAAQGGDGVPSCAQPCVAKYTTGDNIAGCKSLDVACICRNDSFLDGIACCVEEACDSKGKEAAVDYAKQICEAQGIKVPAEVVCKTATNSTPTPSGGDAAPEETQPGAASGLQAAGGLVGAAVAMLMAL